MEETAIHMIPQYTVNYQSISFGLQFINKKKMNDSSNRQIFSTKERVNDMQILDSEDSKRT